MKVPVKWLRDYVDLSLSPKELAERLTMAGTEVKDIQVIGGKWDDIIIGQVAEISPHPNADRLRLATVDLGTEKQTVVCGAPNLNIGDKIAFARLGAELTDPHTGKSFKLTTAKIRGVVSSGMVVSEKELGISENHEGIMVLPPEAPVGTPLADYLGDAVLDMEVTPNRADCLSVIGIAREAAALTGQTTHIPEVKYEEMGAAIEQQIVVEIADPDLCSRYCASLINGIKIGESPRWMQERLIACGMRPINNVVDITNYVMLEHGQPLHAFDFERIRGRKIIVRRAKDGEVIISLDGAERKLSSDMLVIADTERAVAVAGVMGGANSEVSENTTILLESANFNPTSIHYTARKLLMCSEASTRFERGIRPGLTIPALRHATQLILELAGGKASKGIVDVYPGKKEPQPISLQVSQFKRILGVEFSRDQILKTLTSLGFDVKVTSREELSVISPYWRGDISLAVDVIEEVARISGYDEIPITLLGQPLPHQKPNLLLNLKSKINDCLTGYGFQEAVTYSLTSLDSLSKLASETNVPEPKPLQLVNPMTADQEYLRTNLRAGLLTTLAANRRHEEGCIWLFELNKVYLPHPNNLPDEPLMLCGILSGAREEKSWLGGEEQVSFFDAKGIAESLLSKIGVEATFEPGSDEGLHPLRQAAIVIDGNKLGVIGEVHPKVADAFEITEPVYLFEINVTSLLPYTAVQRLYKPIPRFPGIVRDLALVVDFGITHRQVQDIIRSFPLVSEVKIFDVYSGKQVPEGKKSMGYRILYQSPTQTLTDEEVDRVQQNILDRLSHQLGASLRG